MQVFKKIERQGWTAMVRADAVDAVAGALLDGAGCEPVALGGRGNVARFAWPGGQGILRIYKRGGFVRHFLKDAYVLANRPLSEYQLLQTLAESGLTVPAVLGVCWSRRGLLVRGAIATEALDAVHLQSWLDASPPEPEAMLRQCGALIRKMHDLRVWHADLQIRNILVGESEPWLIDFDNARRVQHLTPLLRARNLLRLRRSMQKNLVPEAYFKALCEGYGGEALPVWLSRAYSAKGRISDVIAGRGKLYD